MSSRFRTSKFRNAACKAGKQEERFSELSIGNLQSDASHIKCSGKHIAFNWDSGGGGSLGIVPVGKPGKFNRNVPQIHAHTNFVSDFDFSRFDDDLIATGATDQPVKIWRLPSELSGDVSTAEVELSVHSKRVEAIQWHTTTDNILATASSDVVRVWDINKSSEIYTLNHSSATVQSICWSGDGQFLATCASDKKLRVFDPRTATSASAECEAHFGGKGLRVLWLGNEPRILTTGAGRAREREFSLWDFGSMGAPVSNTILDTSTSILLPLYDPDTSMIFLAGKGDSSIRFLDYDSSKKPYLFPGVVHVADDTQVGACLATKRALNVMSCEVNRVLRLTKSGIVPCSFFVPRKSHTDFHEDIFPKTAGTTPALVDAEAWMAATGMGAVVPTVSLDPSKRAEWDDQAPVSATTTLSSSQRPNGISACNSIDSEYQPENSAKAKAAVAIVRTSKFRNVFGTVMHKKNSLESIQGVLTTSGTECNVLIASSKFIAFPIAGNGGRICVLPISCTGRFNLKSPCVQNGGSPIDYQFDPFNPNILLCACDDSYIRVWHIPDGGLTEELMQPKLKLKGHQNRVNIIRFHPTSNGVVVSASNDLTMKLWDSQTGEEKASTSLHGDIVSDIAFSSDGRRIATVCKDGKVRVLEMRTGNAKVISEGNGHENPRAGRLCWVGDRQRLLSVGFDHSSQRELVLLDAENVGNVLVREIIDVSSSVTVPTYDEDTGILFLVGRGDSSVYMFEIEDDIIHRITPWKATSQHLGACFLDKRSCDVKKVEFRRCLRLSANTIESVQFFVPRTRKEWFQDDVFPPTRKVWAPRTTAANWFNGNDGEEMAPFSLQPEGMTKLSERPPEAPKAKKYISYNPEEESPEDKKEKLLNNLVAQAGAKGEDSVLAQDLAEGCDEDEWDNY